MISPMFRIISNALSLRNLLILLLSNLTLHAEGIRPLSNREVLVLYNKADPESEQLAHFYRDQRAIPPTQVLGLDLPNQQDITREEYEKQIVQPLRDHFDQKVWWNRSRDSSGIKLPLQNRIRAIVLMRGIPLRIQGTAPTEKETASYQPNDVVSPRDEASVDSELAMFGLEKLPARGVLKNEFYKSEKTLAAASIPHLMLTTRIDAPNLSTCKKMIEDAIESERYGLWGRAYVDVANKYPDGDAWLNRLAEQSIEQGIPTIVDRFNETLPKSYPMTEAAMYYGWYDGHVSGPFQNASFHFKPGAIAVHLHSFSGEQLRDPHKNWCAPLLARGAAATLGNVYEPYLHLTHQFDIFHDRLLRGWTFAEAAWASMLVTSWQGIALGDPLYRPFLHFQGTGEKRREDREFRALRAAAREWKNQDKERRKNISEAADNLQSGNLAEALALEYLQAKDFPNASIWLNKALEYYPKRNDKLRQELQLIAIERTRNDIPLAIQKLKQAIDKYPTSDYQEPLTAWLNLLAPPPPPIDPKAPVGQ